MVELKRVYWSRKAMRLAYTAAVMWLGISVFLALMPKVNVVSGTGLSPVTEVLRGMLDGVLAAAVLPGLCLVVLAVVAAVVQARTFDAGTR